MDYQPLLHKIANKFPDKYKEDLLSEGYLALHKASELFDPEHGAPFQTYAYKEVFGTMNRYVKQFNNTVSLDNEVADADGMTTYADLLESDVDVESQVAAKDYYDKNLEQSTPIERFIKQRHYEEGLTPKEIVELYSELTLINDVRTIKKILKK